MEYSTIVIMVYFGGKPLIYALARDTRLTGEKITPLISRMASRVAAWRVWQHPILKAIGDSA